MRGQLGAVRSHQSPRRSVNVRVFSPVPDVIKLSVHFFEESPCRLSEKLYWSLLPNECDTMHLSLFFSELGNDKVDKSMNIASLVYLRREPTFDVCTADALPYGKTSWHFLLGLKTMQKDLLCLSKLGVSRWKINISS